MTSDSTPILGVLGGMGPLAGAFFMQRLCELTPAERDLDHLPAILVNDPRIPDRVGPIIGRSTASPLPAMVAAVERLERAGAAFVAIACNTAHYWHGELSAAVKLPVLSMMEAAAEELKARRLPGPVGLMATDGTIRAGLYQKALSAAGLEVRLPSETTQKGQVHNAIDAVKRGQTRRAPALAQAAGDALKREGARTLLIACTELSVAWPLDQRRDVVDAQDALVRACIRRAGREPKPAA